MRIANKNNGHLVLASLAHLILHSGARIACPLQLQHVLNRSKVCKLAHDCEWYCCYCQTVAKLGGSLQVKIELALTNQGAALLTPREL